MMKSVAAGLMLSAFALVALPVFAANAAVVVAPVAVGAAVNVDGFVAPAMLSASASGKTWVDAKGMTLYTFDKDKLDGKSMCNGDCAIEWPPMMVVAGAVASGDWTIVTRDDGTLMWAYEGHPLYTFLDDKKAGDMTGDNQDGFHIAM